MFSSLLDAHLDVQNTTCNLAPYFPSKPFPCCTFFPKYFYAVYLHFQQLEDILIIQSANHLTQVFMEMPKIMEIIVCTKM